MGTNYYAKIIPPSEVVDKLLSEIKNDTTLNGVVDKFNFIYGPFRVECGESRGNIVHLGKNSCGWKFLWNPNVYRIIHGKYSEGVYVREPDTLMYLYPLTKQGITDFVMRSDVVVYDEYDTQQDKQQFLEFALNKTEGWDSKAYYEETKEHPYKIDNEIHKLLEQDGFKWIGPSESDFYSDGLRFAAFTDFS